MDWMDSPLLQLAVVLLIPLIVVPLCILIVRAIRLIVVRARSTIPGQNAMPPTSMCAGVCGNAGGGKGWRSSDSLRRRIALYLATSDFGNFWTMLQIILSVASCIIYVVETYEQDYSVTYFTLECVLTGFFAIDYVVFFYAAQDRLMFFFSFFALVDLFAVYPFVVSLFITVEASHVLRMLLMLRSLRIVRTYKLLSIIGVTNVQRQVVVVLLTIFSLLFCSAALIQFLENYNNHDEENPFYYFHTCMYFVIVTFSTVGFGDITPQSFAGRMALMVLISLSGILIPMQTLRLVGTMSKHSPYDGRYRPARFRGQHVVVVGHITYSAIVSMLREIFNRYNSLRHATVVLLSPEHPSGELLALVQHPYFRSRVRYLVGSPMIASDLQRADLAHASACFVLTNRYCIDINQADSEAILQLLAVKDFASDIKTGIQLVQNKHKHHISCTGNLQAICFDEVKMGIMGKSASVRGFATFVTNLVRTYNLDDYEFSNASWESEYHYGCANEIYGVELPDHLSGKSFAEVAKLLYVGFGATLLAIECDVSQMRLSELNGVDRSSLDLRTALLSNPPPGIVVGRNTKAYVLALSTKTCSAIRRWEMVAVGDVETAEHVLSDFVGEELGVRLGPLGTPNSHLLSDASSSSLELDFEPYSLERGIGNMFEQMVVHGGTGGWGAVVHVKDECVSRKQAWVDDGCGFESHIIVCGNLAGIEHFIAPLRTRTIREADIQPVLILHPMPPTDAMWAIIGRFPEVYYVQGSGLVDTDLQRAGIKKASSIVLLTNPLHHGKDPHMLDADNIFIFRMICKKYTSVEVLHAELAFAENIKYIQPGIGRKLAAGNTTASNSPAENFLLEEHHFHPIFAAGEVYVSSMMDSMMCQVINNHSLLELLSVLIFGGSDSDQVQLSSTLVDIAVPSSFVGRRYSEMFQWLLDREEPVVPVALYRSREAYGTMHPFVSTNPHPDTQVCRGDRVYVLSPAAKVVQPVDDGPRSESAAQLPVVVVTDCE